MKQRKVIYDFGANDGQNIPYYLMKGDLVVAVEANPVLCERLVSRYGAEIKAGRLVVENKVLDAAGGKEKVPFFVHKHNHVLSQFPKPEHNFEDFVSMDLPASSPGDLIEKYGYPHYVKIDIENYDVEILRAVFGAGIFPEYISAECLSAEVVAVIIASGQYQSYKMVESALVSKTYKNCNIVTVSGQQKFSFLHHSAGPYGDDILGKWFTEEGILRVLGVFGFGWKDIHAARTPTAKPVVISLKATLIDYLCFRMKIKLALAKTYFGLG